MEEEKGIRSRKAALAAPQAMPSAGQFYRYFKGGLYQIIGRAYNAADDREMVVYQALYGDYRWYVRAPEEFMSPVDGEKYPQFAGRQRFERVEPAAEPDRTARRSMPAQPEREADRNGAFMAEKKRTVEETVKKAPEAFGEEPGVRRQKETPEEEIEESSEEQIRPELLRFLDAGSAAEKLRVLREIRGNMDETLLTNLELSLDLMPDERESAERRLELVELNLEKSARFEGGRLR